MTTEWNFGSSLNRFKERNNETQERLAEHIGLYKQSCQKEVFTESIFWYDKKVGKGVGGIWKEERMDSGVNLKIENFSKKC